MAPPTKTGKRNAAATTLCPSCKLSNENDSVACDRCNIYYHFACVGEDASVATRDWSCAACLIAHTSTNAGFNPLPPRMARSPIKSSSGTPVTTITEKTVPPTLLTPVTSNKVNSTITPSSVPQLPRPEEKKETIELQRSIKALKQQLQVALENRDSAQRELNEMNEAHRADALTLSRLQEEIQLLKREMERLRNHQPSPQPHPPAVSHNSPLHVDTSENSPLAVNNIRSNRRPVLTPLIVNPPTHFDEHAFTSSLLVKVANMIKSSISQPRSAPIPTPRHSLSNRSDFGDYFDKGDSEKKKNVVRGNTGSFNESQVHSITPEIQR